MSSVVVVGSLNVDSVVRLARFPVPGETVTGLSHVLFPGGKGGNQAYAAARLGESGQLAGITLELPAEDDGPALALADEGKLRQVIINVLLNGAEAVAEAPRRALRLSVERRDHELGLHVADSGPGISRDVLPRIFTPYARAAPGDGSAEESIGLGLALAHGLVRAMGGELSVGSSGPGGTSMHLRLPA